MTGVRRTATLRLDRIESALSHVRSRGATLSAPHDLTEETRALILRSVAAFERGAGALCAARTSSAAVQAIQ